MGFWDRIRQALAPRVVVQERIITEPPLYQQFHRIGGALTPKDVSNILAEADSGYTYRLVDLGNESRQKDGHLHSVLETRELAVAGLPLTFVAPEDATDQEFEAVDLCKAATYESRNFPDLVAHLTGSFFFSHATAESDWQKTPKGQLLPRQFWPVRQRQFIFWRGDGSLRWRPPYAFPRPDGVDLLEEHPGRFIQVQRRINGDAPVREGLIRVLTWAALFRNWSLRDWIALGELGWKPWRIGTYKQGASKEDIANLYSMLQSIGSAGIGVKSETTQLDIEWPKGMAPGTGGSGMHSALFDTIGREMSKAVLGTTDSTEAGPNGSRAAVQTRDGLRLDRREADAIAVASALRRHLYGPTVRLNLGPNVRVPVPIFQTSEGVDQLSFSEAINYLHQAGLQMPAHWVREQIGMPDPEPDDELLGIPITVDTSGLNDTSNEAA